MAKSGKVLSLQIPILFVITFLELNNDLLATTTTTKHTKICWKGCNNYLAKVNNQKPKQRNITKKASVNCTCTGILKKETFR